MIFPVFCLLCCFCKSANLLSNSSLVKNSELLVFSSEHVLSDVKTQSEEDAAADALGDALSGGFFSGCLTLKTKLSLLLPVSSSFVFKLFDINLSISSVLNSFCFLGSFFFPIINLLVG